MNLSFYALRFHFAAKDRICFGSHAGNTIRGAFGSLLRHGASLSLYRSIFEPAGGTGPSGFANSPRPFVVRGAHLDNVSIESGCAFYFDVHLFDCAPATRNTFAEAFNRLANEGIGDGRGRAELRSIDGLDAPISMDLTARRAISKLAIDFQTPTELKYGSVTAAEPLFPILFSRARDRVSTLRALYGEGPLEIDFREMAERSQAIRMTHCDIEWADRTRTSSRTGQSHSIGGFVGNAVYEGDLTEFFPYVQAAEYTGIGRHTVWGNGAIHVTTSTAEQPEGDVASISALHGHVDP
jgi:hypothetical protein